ncbi:PO113 protein, partial [Todus mexicanus]|nr:PO113 protein [Todus mexicanus]
ADHLAGVALVMPPVPVTLEQACLSHAFYHQSAKALKWMFSTTLEQARQIIATCPDCQLLMLLTPGGINPRGTEALQLWQTDVTHIPEYVRLCFVHVSVDTFSGVIWATPL